MVSMVQQKLCNSTSRAGRAIAALGPRCVAFSGPFLGEEGNLGLGNCAPHILVGVSADGFVKETAPGWRGPAVGALGGGQNGRARHVRCHAWTRSERHLPGMARMGRSGPQLFVVI